MKKSFLLTITLLIAVLFILAGCSHPDTPSSSSEQTPAAAPAPTTLTTLTQPTPVRVQVSELVHYILNLEGTTYDNPALIEIEWNENNDRNMIFQDVDLDGEEGQALFYVDEYYELFFTEGIETIDISLKYCKGLRAIHIPDSVTLFHITPPASRITDSLTDLYLPYRTNWWKSDQETSTSGLFIPFSNSFNHASEFKRDSYWWHKGNVPSRSETGTSSSSTDPDPSPFTPGPVTPAEPVNP